MQSISKIGLPLMQTEPLIDWYIDCIDQPSQQVYLSYACHRDFLSVPSTHQIVQIIGSETMPAVVSQVSVEEISRSTESNQAVLKHSDYEPGLYQLSCEQGCEWLLIDKDSVFKLTFSDYNCLAQRYFHLTAEEAFESFLNDSE